MYKRIFILVLILIITKVNFLFSLDENCYSKEGLIEVWYNDTTSSISDNYLNSSSILSPIPAKEYIRINLIELKNINSISISNLSGKVVKQFSYSEFFQKEEFIWDMHDNNNKNVQSGFYVIRIEENEKVHFEKFLIEK